MTPTPDDARPRALQAAFDHLTGYAAQHFASLGLRLFVSISTDTGPRLLHPPLDDDELYALGEALQRTACEIARARTTAACDPAAPPACDPAVASCDQAISDQLANLQRDFDDLSLTAISRYPGAPSRLFLAIDLDSGPAIFTPEAPDDTARDGATWARELAAQLLACADRLHTGTVPAP